MAAASVNTGTVKCLCTSAFRLVVCFLMIGIAGPCLFIMIVIAGTENLRTFQLALEVPEA
jgi:hypothetical protein